MSDKLYVADNVFEPERGLPVRVRWPRIRLPGKATWKTNRQGWTRLRRRGRLRYEQETRFDTFAIPDDFPADANGQLLDATRRAASPMKNLRRSDDRKSRFERCILMTTDPGDLVLDPTCGSGTTAYVAEQWGRRWITIDTSRVALALARARIMGARYPLLPARRLPEGQRKEAEITRTAPRTRARCTATSARASSMSACRTSR